jgi:thiol-disulfide isomerase/thioredoxin
MTAQTPPETPTPRPQPSGKEIAKLFGPHLAVFALALLVGAGGVLYALKRPGKEEAPGACPARSLALAQRLAPLAKGEMAGFTVPASPRLAPDLAFDGPDGKPASLSHKRGKAVLVNLWATWCPPCRKEMPSLDALQQELGSDKFEVMAISLDTRNLERRKAFLDEIGATHLAFYAEPQGRILPIMKAASGVLGLPTTLLVDADGCQLGLLQGEAKWASDEAKTLIKAATGG